MKRGLLMAMRNNVNDSANGLLTVTFDTNVIETILNEDKAQQTGVPEMLIFKALQEGCLQGFVARTYFVHDAIKKGDRISTLCDGIEFRIPANPIFYKRGIGLKVVQTSIIDADSFHVNSIELMHKLNIEVLDFRRKFWPDLIVDLPIKHPPENYYDRVKEIQNVIENELHCGFYRLREFMRNTVGNAADDLALLWQLKDAKYHKKALDIAFAEAGDGDALITHYGYGINLFCTNDRANKAGAQSVFSQSNRNVLYEKFNLEIVSPSQLAEIIKKYGGTDRA